MQILLWHAYGKWVIRHMHVLKPENLKYFTCVGDKSLVRQFFLSNLILCCKCIHILIADLNPF